MSWWVNLLTQVRNKLPVKYGGTGHAFGTTWVLKSCQNSTGSSIAIGTVVEMLGSYDDTRVRPVVAENATTVVGVVVGYFSDNDGTTLVQAAAPDGAYVAVCVVGSVKVLIGAAVTRGQYAYVHATDGQAKSSATLVAGAFGVFEESASSGSARVRIPGGTSPYGAGIGDIVSNPSADQTITAQSATVLPLGLIGAASQTDNMFEVRDSSGTVLAYIFYSASATQIVAQHASATAPAPQLRAHSFGDVQGGSGGFVHTKSRGTTVGAHGIVASGDNLGSIDFRGSDGSAYRPGVQLLTAVDGTPGASDMPGRFSIATTADGAAVTTERLRVDSAGNVKLFYGLRLGGVISPAQITADQNDYAPSGGDAATTWRLSTDASRKVTGIASPIAGDLHILANTGSTDLVLAHENTGSTAANRFTCPSAQDFTLKSGNGVLILYDGTSARWRVLAISTTGGTVGQSATNGLGWYGDGSDGTVTISSGTTSLARDMYYDNLTVSGTGILDPNGFRVHVKNTLTISATVRRIPNNGSSASAGAGLSNSSKTIGGSPAGGSGANAVSANGSNGGNSSNSGGGAGGAGGDSDPAPPVRTGGTGGTVSLVAGTNGFRALPQAGSGQAVTGQSTVSTFQGGAGGGGGANDTAAGGNFGGGGGGGGGVVIIAARVIDLQATGVIEAKGGNGANGAGATGGGGGGGGGGLIIVISDSLTEASGSSISAAGGIRGTGAGTGLNGVDGSAGSVVRLTP